MKIKKYYYILIEKPNPHYNPLIKISTFFESTQENLIKAFKFTNKKKALECYKEISKWHRLSSEDIKDIKFIKIILD